MDNYGNFNTGDFSAGLGVFFIITFLLSYALTVYPTYVMFKRANLKNPNIAFIPIIGAIKTFNLANMSMWVYLGLVALALIPFVGSIAVLVISCYMQWTIAKNFGLGTLGCILALFFGLFVYWYIALTKRPFIGQLNPKFTE